MLEPESCTCSNCKSKSGVISLEKMIVMMMNVSTSSTMDGWMGSNCVSTSVATEMPMGSQRRNREARWAARGARMGAASGACQ